MNTRTLWHVSLALGVAVVLFASLQGQVRDLEVYLVVGALQPILSDAVLGAGSSIVVVPRNEIPFLAEVRPSCSAAGAITALAVLGSLISRRGRLKATLAAVTIVALGNLIRIGASIGVGVAYGKSSLVLFHDAVGGAFTFLYIVLGFGTYLWFTLPMADRC